MKTVAQVAKEHEARKVLEVHLRIGQLTLLSIERVKFCYEAIAKNTVMEGSRLYVEQSGGRVKCNSCSYMGDVKYRDDRLYHIPAPVLGCPRCDNAVEVVEGNECVIESIRLEV